MGAMTVRARTYAALVASLLAVSACSSTTQPTPVTSDSVPTLTTAILREYDRGNDAFTQGFEIDGDVLYEGTGLEGSSFVRRTSLETMTELDRVDLPSDLFGEGITVDGDTLWQITWQDGVAIARDRDTLTERRRVNYEGEGWGLCTQTPDNRLVMSDGSSTLTFRDPTSFEAEGTVNVTLDGNPVERLNELECADDGSVYANVWQTFDIMRIDPETGAVTAVIDGTPLWDSMSDSQRGGADVFNGIAQIPGTDRFLVTGKYWPTIFEVQFTDTASVGQN
ncbi:MULTISPECIES: glutaminyl-peptide cyclotransferase [unclassified Rhodococcus (in: high G+C Gram-positive bacteria)]|uniref:glutaminyl-peptide cyclotransferase n=2 Tax=unclassified Rhodococcus (in: high G+C Gram-positive bacteria) TaxID=192944 RepID=UPI0011EDD4A0|nr:MULTISPECIES: glutaminyl-peptide cyclotransferase [unclassified Rhodococcus (in: high G+C Gram-positive bacteria)]KAA0927703.1 glutaminyl-peptide cyclotransferase [Rhodococcus sp. ANT_H53B]MDI9928038.1 glutaminyl-peptide cyclotransferase [Rhodococcus sp. IEGM 1341]